MRKEDLVARPVRHALKESQRHLTIWYDSKAGNLTMKQEGIHITQLPPDDVIFQHKIEDYDDGDTRHVQFHVVFKGYRHVILASHNRKSKLTVLSFNKKKEFVSTGTFPLELQDDIMSWKLALYYNVESGNFLLFINGKAFLSMPYKASLALQGP